MAQFNTKLLCGLHFFIKTRNSYSNTSLYIFLYVECSRHGALSEQYVLNNEQIRKFAVTPKKPYCLFIVVTCHICKSHFVNHTLRSNGYQCNDYIYSVFWLAFISCSILNLSQRQGWLRKVKVLQTMDNWYCQTSYCQLQFTIDKIISISAYQISYLYFVEAIHNTRAVKQKGYTQV